MKVHSHRVKVKAKTKILFDVCHLFFDHFWFLLLTLVRVTGVLDLLFCPKILGRWWEPTKVFFCSVNVHRMVALFAGGGDT